MLKNIWGIAILLLVAADVFAVQSPLPVPHLTLRQSLDAASPTASLALSRIETRQGFRIPDSALKQFMQSEVFQEQHALVKLEICGNPKNAKVLSCRQLAPTDQ